MSVAGRIYRGARSIDAPKQPRLALPEACPCCGRAVPGERISIWTPRRTIYVPIEDVLMFRARDKIIEIWTRDGLAGVIEATLTDLAKRYPKMWRAHREALIDPERVIEARRREGGCKTPVYSAIVDGLAEPVSISRRQWADFDRRKTLGFRAPRRKAA